MKSPGLLAPEAPLHLAGHFQFSTAGAQRQAQAAAGGPQQLWHHVHRPLLLTTWPQSGQELRGGCGDPRSRG